MIYITSKFKLNFSRIIIGIMAVISALTPICSYAEESKTTEEYLEEAEERKSLPVETNEVGGWPDGPIIGAEAAILMDADSGQILYAKNIDEHLYPASTTKIMTCVVAMEHTSMNDIVSVNQSAIDANDWDGSNMALKAGEKLTIDDLLHGILITSANEACNAVAEYVSGDMDSYVELMNQKAAELGCNNTHFVTTNGLHDTDHYTCARDLALIAREFFGYETLCHISTMKYYDIPATADHERHELYSKNQLYEGRPYEYEYLVGSKTGYTGDSRQCLVSCAEKDGRRLICVIMKEESPYQFEDTINLFEYGFGNFSEYNINTNSTKYEINNEPFFTSGTDIFGETDGFITVDNASTVLLPAGTDIETLESLISFEEDDDTYFAYINYYFNGYYIGRSGIRFKDNSLPENNMSASENNPDTSETKPVLINIKSLILRIVLCFVCISILLIIASKLRRVFARGKKLRNIKEKNESPFVKKRNIKRSLARERYKKSSYNNKINNKNNTKTYHKTGKRNNINFDDFNL